MNLSQASIDIIVEAGDWPAEAELRALAESAVLAAAAVASTGKEPSEPSHIPSHKGERGRTPGDAAGSAQQPELSILFTDDTHMRRLNARWRGKDKPTNVLSFPQVSGPMLGDVVLAFETVEREAALARKPLEEHMMHLIVHGFLHLLGYEHEVEEEANEMEALERAALGRMGLSDPYATAWEE